MYRCATKAGTTSYMAIPSVFMTATSLYWHRWKPDLSTNPGLMLSLFPPPIQNRQGTADGVCSNKVYGMAERNSDSWNISARYQKYNFILKNMQLNASLSHTWDHSLTVDTAYRKYYWDGGYIVSQRNEIMGKEPSMRHYKRPLTIMRTNLDYQLNTHHSFNLNYHLSRTGNDRFDDLDTSFEPSKDVVTKHILGLSYNQSLLDGKMETYSS